MSDANKQPANEKARAIEAQWSISLYCDCPNCKAVVDLLEYPDFRHLDIGEHGTQQSEGIEVVCPVCGHEFEVNLVY
jgi:hypothetical protein